MATKAIAPRVEHIPSRSSVGGALAIGQGQVIMRGSDDLARDAMNAQIRIAEGHAIERLRTGWTGGKRKFRQFSLCVQR
ncbi:MAG: hypothetical protein C7B45_12350 [Sulfobacillus acidophilus]|uniref:Uncharacterized protein n=1 Tax=Sulfobacillus acidophilus TaxID=53633 RepID=A0A2T2WFK3_9FIRM|nr:MAG: hypothetical protein C7B45_12350 [Sulfobacillus acidophilus]